MSSMHPKYNNSSTFWFSESFTTNFSPDKHKKKAKYSFCHENFMKGNKTTNKEGILFLTHPVVLQK